jgi:rubrerythrin
MVNAKEGFYAREQKGFRPPEYCHSLMSFIRPVERTAMPNQLPTAAPQSIGAAFAHINALTSPGVDDLKVMVLLEAAGLELYRGMAAGTDNAAVAALLEHNGREEMAHAHRVAKAIKAISGEDYPPPESADNPYLTGPIPSAPLTADGLRGLAQGEFAGEGLYERWAANCANAEAARLFLLNGGEEREHGDRLIEAAGLL